MDEKELKYPAESGAPIGDSGAATGEADATGGEDQEAKVEPAAETEIEADGGETGEKYVWVKERYDGEKPKTFKGRLANFWYHHKWHTLVSVAVIALISVIVMQFVGRQSYDITVIYAGGHQFSRLETNGEQSDYQTAFESLEAVGADFDGNGEISIHLRDYYYLTEAEIAALEADGLGDTINYNKLLEDRDNLHQSIMTGDACLLFLSSALYDELYYESAFGSGGELFVDLGDMLERSGASGYEFYGEGSKAVLLHSLKFADSPAIEALPEDTVVCLRIQSEGFAGIGKASDTYKNSVAMIKKLFAFGVNDEDEAGE